MPRDAAQQLRPIRRFHWNPALAAHLLNRAGFGGSPDAIDALHAMGPEKAVLHLVDYAATPWPDDPTPAWAAEGELAAADPAALRSLSDEERRERQQRVRIDNRLRLVDLRAWWLARMRYSPRPLEEKLTLFWHGHFATSIEKVKSAYAMYLQNHTLRAHAAGSWPGLLEAVTGDPAMLIYLDGAQNRKAAPNENYARELFELFTLGEGHYTEDEVHEAARALTGWQLDRAAMTAEWDRRRYDAGTKRLFGRTGSFDGGEVIEIVCEQPRAAEFLAERLWSFFAYRDPDPDLVQVLASHLRQHDFQLQPFLHTLFRSRAFYSGPAFRTQIKSPVQWFIGALTSMEAPLPPPAVCDAILDVLGQRLFEPPNVAGWEGGEAWINAATLLHRYNLAAFLTSGLDGESGAVAQNLRRAVQRASRAALPEDADEPARNKARRDSFKEASRPVMDPRTVLPEAVRTDRDGVREHLQWRLFQSRLEPNDVQAFESFFAALPDPAAWTDAQIRETVHLLMSSPHYQLT